MVSVGENIPLTDPVAIVLPAFKSLTFLEDKEDSTRPVDLLTNFIDSVVTNKSLKGLLGEPKSQLPEPSGIIEPVTVNAVNIEPLYSHTLR